MRSALFIFPVAYILLVGGCGPDVTADFGISCDIPEFARQCDVLEIVNEVRDDDGQSPLEWNNELTLAAQAHAEDMFELEYFSHTSQDGRSFVDRVNETDYDATPTGENIAYGYPSSEAVMDAWMNSSGHRANILSSGSTEIGIGFYENYWVQVFGRRTSQ